MWSIFSTPGYIDFIYYILPPVNQPKTLYLSPHRINHLSSPHKAIAT